MGPDLDLFVALAEIAGIFVGFGALISITGSELSDPIQLGRLRSVVVIGLLVIAAALVPVTLDRYEVSGYALWGGSSGIFLLFIWISVLAPLFTKSTRREFLEGWRSNLAFSLFFLIVLEVPIQAPLLMAVLGVAPSLAPAFYTTALVVSLFEAAALLVLVVYTGPGAPPRQESD